MKLCGLSVCTSLIFESSNDVLVPLVFKRQSMLDEETEVIGSVVDTENR